MKLGGNSMSIFRFDKAQWKEIILGLVHGVNVTEYTNKREGNTYLSAKQMKQVREGLQAKINVRHYNIVRLFPEEMRMIKELLIAGVREEDYFNYRNFEYPPLVKDFYELYYALEKGVNINRLFDEGYYADQVVAICKYLAEDIPLLEYVNTRQEATVIHLIGMGIMEDLDISGYMQLTIVQGIIYFHMLSEFIEFQKEGFDVQGYIKSGYKLLQIMEIAKGKRKLGEKVKIYDNREFSYRQMREIRHGLLNGVDVSIYAKVIFSEDQMKMIRLGLEEGLDVSGYAKPEFSSEKMRILKDALHILKEHDIKVML